MERISTIQTASVITQPTDAVAHIFSHLKDEMQETKVA